MELRRGDCNAIAAQLKRAITTRTCAYTHTRTHSGLRTHAGGGAATSQRSAAADAGGTGRSSSYFKTLLLVRHISDTTSDTTSAPAEGEDSAIACAKIRSGAEVVGPGARLEPVVQALPARTAASIWKFAFSPVCLSFILDEIQWHLSNNWTHDHEIFRF